MKIAVTITREYEMDETKILGTEDFDPPPSNATIEEKRHWLMESFWELCGFERDVDHLDGTYVHLTDEIAATDFEWPEALS